MTSKSSINLYRVFENFCESSSIHGTSYWHRKYPLPIRVVWATVTIVAFISGIYMILNCFKNWELNPVIVSVWQVPIENSPFPGITICPLDDSKFGAIELILNDISDVDNETKNHIREWFILFLRGLIKDYKIVETQCSLEYCSRNLTLDCSEKYSIKVFNGFINKYNNEFQDGNFDDFVENEIFDFAHELAYGEQKIEMAKENDLSANTPRDFEVCNRMISIAYLLYISITEILKERSKAANKSIRIGSLVTWMLSHARYLPNDEYSRSLKRTARKIAESVNVDLTSQKFGGGSMFIPDMISAISSEETNQRNDVSGIRYSPQLLQTMKESLSPAAVTDTSGLNPNPGIPFCFYENKDDGGIKLEDYKTKFCQDMQPVVNDEGLCYSFNNENFKLQPGFDETAINRNVRGTGKKKGLTLIVDSHNLKYGREKSKGYKILVAKRGDIGGKVQYTVNPDEEK